MIIHFSNKFLSYRILYTAAAAAEDVVFVHYIVWSSMLKLNQRCIVIEHIWLYSVSIAGGINFSTETVIWNIG